MLYKVCLATIGVCVFYASASVGAFFYFRSVYMKSAGAIIKFDELGRVVIPKSIRDRLGYETKTAVEVFADDNGVYLRKYEPECIICGSNEDIQIVNGKKFCKQFQIPCNNVGCLFGYMFYYWNCADDML